MRNFKFPIVIAVLAVCLALSTEARANLIINVDGMTVSNPNNTSVTFMGGVGGFNINHITMAGVNAFGGNGMLVDNGSLNISSNGTGSLTIFLTETNLTVGPFGAFSVDFTGSINNAKVTRSFYVDQTNSGQLTNLLGSTTEGNATFTKGLSLSGPFSLTEEITVTPTGRGAMLSSDDNVVDPVPEPTSLALLVAGVASIGLVSRRRKI